MFEFVFKKSMTPAARRLFFILLAVALVLVALHAIILFGRVSHFWVRLLHLSHEYAVSSTYSSTLLLAITLAALVNAVWAVSSRWQRVYFLLLAMAYLFLALDEYFVIHEHIGPWVIVYPIAGVVFVVANLAAYRFAFRGEISLFALVVGGFGLMGASGVGFEVLGHHVLCKLELTKYYCHYTDMPEEFFELVGIYLALAGLLSFGRIKLGAANWRLAKRLVAGGSVLWGVSLAVYFWVFPALEARFLAQPVEANYFNGELSLVGYRVSRKIIAPGDRLTVTLYWQAHSPVDDDYNLSVHLVTHPEVNSVAQADMPMGGWLGWNTLAWPPGVVMRDVVRLDVPEDLPTPSSYWITLRIWHQYVEVPVFQADRQLLEADDLVLSSVPALSGGALPAPEIESRYQFADGYTLAGYSLPERAAPGETLPLDFWWTTQTDVDVDAVQFIHLIPDGGGEAIAHDQPPFEDAFPTADWPAGMAVVDSLAVPLAGDMPPGDYRVYTGMYVLETGERRSVVDREGQPVTDNAVYLGTVTVTP